MFVASISIRRQGYFGSYGGGVAKPETPFDATIEIHGQHGKTELKLSPDMSQRVLDIIADEVAAAGRSVAEAMTAQFITGVPAIAAE
jgi:hypothetical protein